MGFTNVTGIDYTLPSAPPLTQPPLSLLDLAITLIDNQGLVEQLRVANEKAASAQQRLADLPGGGLEPDEMDSEDEVADAAEALAQMRSQYQMEFEAATSFASSLADRIATLSRWEHGLVYLPELSNAAALEVFEPDSGVTKTVGSNQAPAEAPFYWHDPYVVVSRDERSLFGWPNESFQSRAQRASRALSNHETFQVEYEWWSGASIPTNYHLSASPDTPTTSAHRTIDAWPNPSAAPGTVLGTPVGLAKSLAVLDQAIAESEAGTGMIHATPFVMQEWMKAYPFIRDPNFRGVYTVNHNLLVPGFGYGGTGPDQPDQSQTDGVSTDGSPTFTSATATFTVYDIGRSIVETSTSGSIPDGTYILKITDAHTVVLTQPLVGGNTGIEFTVPGLGGRAGGADVQWCYATEQVYTLRGDIVTYPFDMREGSPLVTVDNSIAVRVERSWGTITNRLLRSAVLVDVTQP